ncbi:unnamed protein product [Blepharisma stoltei]|uniref:Histone deacetylase interacting domain-containing protein n=1 Tax=Blepharisma stoltei TaxID=1481888 RepID=A0AAU9I7H4_9CILI|nr:unnamed protein product [Blepharisma stoltei]
MQNRVDCARKYLTLVRSRFRENGNKYEEFLQIMKAFKEQRVDTEAVCKRVQELFRGHRVLLLEFNKLIPQNYRISVESRPHYNEAIEYMRKVKEETKNDPAIYDEFIKILKQYQSKEMSLDDVNNSVRKLMVNYPVLMDSFKAFLPNYYDESSEEEDAYEPLCAKPLKKRKEPSIPLSAEKIVAVELSDPIGKNELIFFQKLKKVLDLNSQPNTDYFLEFSQCFNLYIVCVITKLELLNVIEPLFRVSNAHNFVNYGSSSRRHQKEENSELTQYVQGRLRDFFETFKVIAGTRESARRKYGWFFKPLSDFDNSKAKRQGHSYLNLQRPAIKRTQPNEKLNSQWISVPYGSEDFSFRNFRKNVFEDALFKCEDERYELDMTIESAMSTLRLLEKAEEKMNSLSPEQQRSFQFNEKAFDSIHMRSIQSIYSEHAPKIIETLKRNPVKALPVVVLRLKSKIDGWTKQSKLESERLWGETVEKNFWKSLDHRSFYFKQNEKRMTNAKAFLGEAKARYNARNENKEWVRKYLKGENSDNNYEFIGGSRHQLFFNSFSGLSAAVSHKVPTDFVNEVIEEFKVLDSAKSVPVYENGIEYASLPHFRLLYNYQPVLNDALRILIFAVEKSNLSDKEKISKWINVIFQDLMQIKLPSDVQNHKVEEFFENIPEEEPQKPPTPIETEDVELTRKIITRWIENDSYTEPEVDSNSLSDLAQDPITLKKDDSFSAFIPLLKNNQIMYCPSSIYCFIRFFYGIYERLLKVKLVLSKDGKDEEKPTIDYGNYSFSEQVESEYLGFLKVVCLVLKNTYDNSKFEEKCRSLLGNDAYILFTFDKLASYTAKALHAVAHDDLAMKALSIFSKFSKHKLNEEMYMAEFLAQSPSAQLFRLHWNVKYKILSITYIESPYEKLQEPPVKNAILNAKHFLSTQFISPLHEELEFVQHRLDAFYQNHSITYSDLANQIKCFNGVKVGLNENSFKMSFIPGLEDYLFNTHFYHKDVKLTMESEIFICRDKNSYIQKVTEIGDKKFQRWREKINKT